MSSGTKIPFDVANPHVRRRLIREIGDPGRLMFALHEAHQKAAKAGQEGASVPQIREAIAEEKKGNGFRSRNNDPLPPSLHIVSAPEDSEP